MIYSLAAARPITEVAEMIRRAKPGDTIRLSSEPRAVLTRRAMERMGVSGVKVEVKELA